MNSTFVCIYRFVVFKYRNIPQFVVLGIESNACYFKITPQLDGNDEHGDMMPISNQFAVTGSGLCYLKFVAKNKQLDQVV